MAGEISEWERKGENGARVWRAKGFRAVARASSAAGALKAGVAQAVAGALWGIGGQGHFVPQQQESASWASVANAPATGAQAQATARTNVRRRRNMTRQTVAVGARGANGYS